MTAAVPTPALLQRPSRDDLKEIGLEFLTPHPANRKRFDKGQLAELAESLKATGQITPAIVRPHGTGFELLAGERRWRAAKLAGLGALLCIVRALDDDQALDVLCIENDQREDPDALQESDLYAAMIAAGKKVPQIATRVGRSVSYVYDRLKLQQLAKPARDLLLAGTIQDGHAILLARLSKADQARAIGDERAQYSDGGLLARDFTLFTREDEDGEREFQYKAKSVGELQAWIDRHVRFEPAKEDLPQLFPETAQALSAAAAAELKIIPITYDHHIPDEAKAEDGTRTWGPMSWRRADGKKGSKTCDENETLGVVAAGPGRGESFRVCIAKKTCRTHWGPEIRAAAKRAKEREAPAASGTASKAPKQESWEERSKREKAEQAKLAEQRKAVLEAIRARGTPSLEELLPFAMAVILENGAIQGADLIETHLAVKLPRYGFAKVLAAVEKINQAQRVEALFYLLVAHELEPYQASSLSEILFPIARQYNLDPKAIAAEVAAKQKAAAKAAADQAAAKVKSAPAKTKPAPNGAQSIAKSLDKTAKARKKAKAAAKQPPFMAPHYPSSLLAPIVGTAPLTRVDATKRLWEYIKKHGLQDKKNLRMIKADDVLRPLFGGKDSLSMFDLTKMMGQHLTLEPPATTGTAAGAESWSDTGWMDPVPAPVEPASLATTAKRLAGDVRREKAAKKAGAR